MKMVSYLSGYILPVFCKCQMMKYAVNDRTVIDTDRISWKTILTPYNPLQDYDRFNRRAIITMQTPKIINTTPCISCNSILTSKPLDNGINNLNYTKNTHTDTGYSQGLQKRVFRFLHNIKRSLCYLIMPFKGLVYAVKFFGNLVHIYQNKRLGGSCQASPLGSGGFLGLPRLAAMSLSRMSGGYIAS